MPAGQSDEGNSTIAFPSSQVTLVRIKGTLKMNQYMGVRSHSFHVWLWNCSTFKEHLTETRRGTLQNSPWDLDHRLYFSKRQLMRNLGLLIIFYLVLTTVYFVSHVSRVFPWFFNYSTASGAFYILKTSTFSQISFHFHQFNTTYDVGPTLQYVKPSPKC